LFVVALDLDKPCTDACAAKLLRVDPTTMRIEQSDSIDRVTAGLALVGNTLWVATRQAVLRVAIDTGAVLPSPVGEFTATETVVGLAATNQPRRVYAVVSQGQDQYALAALDPTSGHVIARGSTIGAGPGGANISHGDYGLWFSIATGMQGYAVKVDPDTLARLDVLLDSQGRPTVQQGLGVLWVDESWHGFLSCADPTTGAILWRKDIQTNPVSFARDTTGRMTPFQGWVPVAAPNVCAQH
jgi:outer membrane protein assembly factor BamB